MKKPNKTTRTVTIGELWLLKSNFSVWFFLLFMVFYGKCIHFMVNVQHFMVFSRFYGFLWFYGRVRRMIHSPIGLAERETETTTSNICLLIFKVYFSSFVASFKNSFLLETFLPLQFKIKKRIVLGSGYNKIVKNLQSILYPSSN